MEFCLGTLLKTIKKYEKNPAKAQITFTNEILGCLQEACDIYAADFTNSDVSKIFSCKRNVPDCLKVNIKKKGVCEKLASNLCLYIEKNLIADLHEELESKIMQLCNKTNRSQLAVYEKLKSFTKNQTVSTKNFNKETLKLSNFLALAFVEAIQLPNKVSIDYLVCKLANSELLVHSGDIFEFAFNRSSKKINIVVIPVNTGFYTHVSKKFEGYTMQAVSINTLHGEWIERMLKRSNTKKKTDNKWIEYNEEILRERILSDLTARGVQSKNADEFPIGTVAVIEEESTIFYLLASSKFDKNNNAHATKTEIEETLNALVRFYDQNGQGFDIYLPLVGTGMSRAGFSEQESFNKICEIFNPENNSYVGKVTIVILPEVSESLELRS